MAGKKKSKYDRIKLLKLASRSTIGEMPKPQVVKSQKYKEPKHKEKFDVLYD